MSAPGIVNFELEGFRHFARGRRPHGQFVLVLDVLLQRCVAPGLGESSVSVPFFSTLVVVNNAFPLQKYLAVVTATGYKPRPFMGQLRHQAFLG